MASLSTEVVKFNFTNRDGSRALSYGAQCGTAVSSKKANSTSTLAPSPWLRAPRAVYIHTAMAPAGRV